MEILVPLILFLVCILSLYIFTCYFGTGTEVEARRNKRLPPGPKPWPILGNILQITKKPHRYFASLSAVHGPIVSLQLGSVKTVIISSTDVARDMFTNHDLALSNRLVPDASHASNHHLHSMAWLPVSPKWRNLRKVASIQLFTAKRLDLTQKLRGKKVLELLEHVGACCKAGQAVDIGVAGFTTTLNLLSNTFFSTDMVGYNSSSSREFKEAIWGMMECIGKPNLADFFPSLSYFDPYGVRRELTTHFSKLLMVFDEVINRRMSVGLGDSSSDEDVLDTLLRINEQGGSDLNLDDIKHLILDAFAAGTDTTSSTLEWAMTELLCNPSKMAKAQAELNEVLATQTDVQESDIRRLPYLQAIVKETFRLHPPAPLLLPRKAIDDVELCGYLIPKNTQVLVNVWAIGRDPTTWQNPNEFLPERFLERVDIDVRGRDFELLPFGSGRRICPGLPLAHRMVHIMLASLLHGFGWTLPNGMGIEEVDMDEKFGITLQKAKPLLALPIPK